MAYHAPQDNGRDEVHHAHDGEQHVAHRRQQRTDENVEQLRLYEDDNAEDLLSQLLDILEREEECK